ncbi:MAG TPA: hypothetical protein VFS40_13160 [Gemmatimonadales bacterium]|nr:hypothetical protein [Gemmatimonadales bacterium]
MSPSRRRRLLPAVRVAAVRVAAVLLLAACGGRDVLQPDDPGSPGTPSTPGAPGATPHAAGAMAARIDGHDYVARSAVGFEGLLVRVNKGGVRLAVAPPPVARDSRDPAVRADYELTVAGTPDGGPLPDSVTFTRFDGYSGALYWIAPGETIRVWLGLYHRSGGHYDAGPFAVDIMRLPHPRTPE